MPLPASDAAAPVHRLAAQALPPAACEPPPAVSSTCRVAPVPPLPSSFTLLGVLMTYLGSSYFLPAQRKAGPAGVTCLAGTMHMPCIIMHACSMTPITH